MNLGVVCDGIYIMFIQPSERSRKATSPASIIQLFAPAPLSNLSVGAQHFLFRPGARRLFTRFWAVMWAFDLLC